MPALANLQPESAPVRTFVAKALEPVLTILQIGQDIDLQDAPQHSKKSLLASMQRRH